MEQEQQSASKRRLGSSEGWILAVCCVAQFMVILDLSIINVALPHIQSALGFSSVDLQWVVDAYSILFASFLMLGGRAADQFGQRRIFVAAMSLFAVASLIGGAANSQGMLVAARGLQGFAGAFMAASSLAIITASFEPGPKLHRAIGTWAAMNGLGGAAGVLFGGIITEALSWRWVLLINPPIGIATALIAFAVVRDRRMQRKEHSFDLAGAITLTVGQIVLVFGVVEAGLRGWDALLALIPIIAGVVLLAAFSYIEGIAKEPLVPIKALTRHLRVANLIVLLFSASLFAMWFVASLYLQQVLGLSPLHTGLIFLPMTLMIIVSASQAGRLVSRFGVRPVLGSGLIMLAGGLVLLARIGPSGSGIVYVMIPGLLASAGIGMSIVPSTIAATQGAKQGQAGLASGLVNTSRQVGGGLGLAVLGTLATQQTSHLIGLGHSVPSSLADGFKLAFLIGAGCVIAAALVTFLLLPSSHAEAAPAPSRDADSDAAPADTVAPAGAALSPAGPGPAGAGEAEADAAAADGTGGPTHKGIAALPGRLLAPGFVVLVAAFIVLDFAFASSKGAPIGAYLKTANKIEHFVTEPSLQPPKLEFEGKTVPSKLAPGYIFASSFYDISEPPMVGQSGPLILDNKLQPVWFKPVPERVVASNLSLETYEGKPALAWWQGVVTNTGATESGEDVIVNQHYEEVAHVKGVNGWKLTLHEILVSGDHVWVTANKDIPRDLSKYGGAYNGALIDSAVQEYSLKTGKLLYNWDALKHIPLSESQATLPTNGFPWDAYHVNAIDLLGNGTFLVSMRDTWAAYLVDIKTGRIKWTLGGRQSDYRFGPDAEFQWQHDVKLHPGGVVTMFDDHCCQLTGGGTYVKASQPSRGLILKLNEGSHTAAKLASYGSGYEVEADYMGSVQQLPNSNVLVGWGSEPFISEFTKSEQPLLEGKFPSPDLSYRTTFGQWVGLPLYPPVGAARQDHGKTTVYASWNGATEVASWRVVAGSGLTPGASSSEAEVLGGSASKAQGAATSASAGPSARIAPHTLAQAPTSGFETAIPLPQSGGSDLRGKSLQVQALDAAGNVIGTSKPFAR